jgi:hypothetical protein
MVTAAPIPRATARPPIRPTDAAACIAIPSDPSSALELSFAAWAAANASKDFSSGVSAIADREFSVVTERSKEWATPSVRRFVRLRWQLAISALLLRVGVAFTVIGTRRRQGDRDRLF